MKNKKLFLSVFVLLSTLAVHAQTLKDAIRLTDDEQYEAATEAFKNLLTTDPTNGTYYFYFGENYLLSDNADQALRMFNKGIQVEPNNVLNSIGLAECKLNKYGVGEMKALLERVSREAERAKQQFDLLPDKTSEERVKLVDNMQAKVKDVEVKYGEAKTNVSDAKNTIDEAIAKAGPKNALALVESADALIEFKNKDLDKAKGLLDKAFALDPKNPEIQILFGDIYSELNNGSLAAEYYNKAIDLDNKSVKSIVSKGKLYWRSTNYEGAGDEFRNAIKIDPAFAPAHRELGEVYFKQGKLDKAKEEYKIYLDLSKNNKSARIRYASFLYISHDYSGAINEINQLSKFDPDNLTLLRVASYCYYETRDTVKALTAVRTLFSKLTDENTAPIDYEYYGKILSLNNMDSSAVIYLRKAYDMDNSRYDILNKIWESYDKLKMNKEAADVLREKIQNGKGVTTVDYFNLGRSCFFAQEFQQADSAFAKLNEVSPKYATGFLWRAKTNSYLDSTSALGLAKPHYEKYIEVASSDTSGMLAGKYKAGMIESYRYLAYYYALNNDNTNTVIYLKKILEIDPEDKNAIEGLSNIEKAKQQKKKL